MPNMNRIQTVWTGIPGTPFLTTLFFAEQEGGAPNGGATAQAAAVRAMWASRSTSSQTNLVAQVQSEVDVIDSDTGQIVDQRTITAAAVSMTGGFDGLPLGTQGQVNLSTDFYFNGRRLRGKLYFPGAIETQSDMGMPNSSYKSAAVSAASTLISEGLVVFSRKNLTYGGVTAVSPSTNWARLSTRRT